MTETELRLLLHNLQLNTRDATRVTCSGPYIQILVRGYERIHPVGKISRGHSPRLLFIQLTLGTPSNQ